MSEQNSKRTRQDIEAHIIAQAWKNEAYKQELLSNPEALIEREFGIKLPAEITVQVMEETPTQLYFSLPMCPNLSGAELSDEQLETVAGGAFTTPACIASIVVGTAFVAGAVDGYLENV